MRVQVISGPKPKDFLRTGAKYLIPLTYWFDSVQHIQV